MGTGLNGFTLPLCPAIPSNSGRSILPPTHSMFAISMPELEDYPRFTSLTEVAEGLFIDVQLHPSLGNELLSPATVTISRIFEAIERFPDMQTPIIMYQGTPIIMEITDYLRFAAHSVAVITCCPFENLLHQSVSRFFD